MKLNSPELIIPEDNPYVNDRFNRKIFGDSLYNLFKNIEDNPIVCLDAQWGEGKTTFIKMWLADLKLKGLECIYFNAYENDHTEDPFIAFSSEIIKYTDLHSQDSEQLKKYKEAFIKIAISIGKRILVSGTKIGIKALTMGAIDNSDIEVLKKLKDEVSAISSGIISEDIIPEDVNSEDAISAIIEEKLKNFHKDINIRKLFSKLLSKMGEEIKKKQAFPLLIIIDELDRCRPDYALILIERIKHLFAVSNVSFLLLTNLKQLENYIETIYGKNIDANNYLLKFITIKTTLPDKKIQEYDSDYSYYFRYLMDHHGINGIGEIESYGVPLYHHLRLSLREIEKCFSLMTLFFANSNNQKITLSEIIPLFALLKIRYATLFDKLKNKELFYNELNSVLELNKVQENTYYRSNFDWLNNILKYFLLTDNEFNALDENDEIKSFKRYFPTTHVSNRNYILASIANKFEVYQNK